MLSSKTKRELKIDQRQILIDSIEIGIPSPQQILTWGERTLPNGKRVGLIKNSKTVNYKRFTPFRDGLFCERIFGPVTSFVCACGKKQSHSKITFCEKCEVEYIDSRSRRYRLGYISLLSPVTHIWYLKGRPGYLSLFLGKRKKTVVALAYCNAYLISHGFPKKNISVKSDYHDRKAIIGGKGQSTKNFFENSSSIWPYMRTASNTDSFFQNKKKSLPLFNFDSKAPCTTKSETFGAYSKKDILNSTKPRASSKICKPLTKGDTFGLTRGYGDEKQPFLCSMPNTFGKKKAKALLNLAFVKTRKSRASLFVKRKALSVSPRKALFCSNALSTREKQKLCLKFCQEKAFIAQDPITFLQNFVIKEGQKEHKKKIKKERYSSCKVSAYLPYLYVRQQTLPFLPSLVCHFYLRDALLNFSHSVATPEDFPLMEYCDTKKWEPLRDVHRFMAHRTVEAFKDNFSYGATRFRKAFSDPRFLEQKLDLHIGAFDTKTGRKSRFSYRTCFANKFSDLAALQIGDLIPFGNDFANKYKSSYKSSYLLQIFDLFTRDKKICTCKQSLGRTKQRFVSGKKICGNKASRFFFYKNKKRQLPSSFVGRTYNAHFGIIRAYKSDIKKVRPAFFIDQLLNTQKIYGVALPAKVTSNKSFYSKKICTCMTAAKANQSLFQVSSSLKLCGSKDSSLLQTSTSTNLLTTYKSLICSRVVRRFVRSQQKQTGKKICTCTKNVPNKTEVIADFSDSERQLSEDTNKSALSGLELIAIREILSYTGGGALQQLLQQFNPHELSKFLFAEAQILRVLYETKSTTEITKGNKVSFVKMESLKSQGDGHAKQSFQNFKEPGVLNGRSFLFCKNKNNLLTNHRFVLVNQFPSGKESLGYPRLQIKDLPYNEKRQSTHFWNRLQKQRFALAFFLRNFAFFKLSKEEEPALLLSRALKKKTKKETFLFPSGIPRKAESNIYQRTKFSSFTLQKTKIKLLAKSCKRLKQNDVFSLAESLQSKVPFVKRTRQMMLLLSTKSVQASFCLAKWIRFLQIRNLYEESKKQKAKRFVQLTPRQFQIKKTNQYQNGLTSTSTNRRFVRRFVLINKSILALLPKLKTPYSLEPWFGKRGFSEPRVKPGFCGSKKVAFVQIEDLLEGDGKNFLSSFCKAKTTFALAKAKNYKHKYKSTYLATRGKKICTIAAKANQESKKSNPREKTYDTKLNNVKGTSILTNRLLAFKGPADLQKKQIVRISRRIYKVARRLKIASLLTRNHRKPEWMILSHLPVLPPDLRPILQMSEKVIVASDLNIMYQRVIYRNNRHLRVRFIDFHLVTAIQRLVQDAVDRLIENGKGGTKPYYTQAGRPLKSLSDILKGKKGRFRLNLLGKRVDFSGRSVIVVSPLCQIHECGLPKEIALELYHYFLLRTLIVKRYCASIVTAKKMIKSKSSKMWEILRILMYHHPVLLNRAPTLHRLGIQAFQPKLVLGNAIALHPLVCSGFNADFDGDQMGVHLPLSFAARAESLDLLWSRNNLLSPATGQPMLVPSQDMVLGFYYMTARSFVTPNKKELYNESISSKALKREALTKQSFVSIGPPLVKGFPFGDRHVKESSLANDSIFEVREKRSFRSQRPTTVVRDRPNKFLNVKEITRSFETGKMKLHQPVWLYWRGKIENDEGSQKPLELRVHCFGLQNSVYEKYISRNVFTKAQAKTNRVEKSKNSNFHLSKTYFPGVTPIPELSKNFAERALTNFRFAGQSLTLREDFTPEFKSINEPFKFYLKPEVCFIRTTAGRVVMNNLLKTKKI